jgi:hypothetical protein
MIRGTVHSAGTNNPQSAKIEPSDVELPPTISFTVGDWTQSRPQDGRTS